MQINAVLNVLMSLPSAATGGLLAGTDASAGTGLMGDTLSAGQGQEFANLLNAGAPIAPGMLANKGPMAGDLLQQASEAGVAKTAGQNLINISGDQKPVVAGAVEDGSELANIAIPVIPTFIDQPQTAEVVLTKDNVLSENAPNKQLIWQNVLANAQSPKMQASEVVNGQEKYTVSKDANAKTEEPLPRETGGKISLASLDTSATNNINQSEFAAAVSKLAQEKQNPTKTELHVQPKVSEAKTVDLETKTAMNEKAAAVEALKQPEETTKITAKIIDIKTDKLHEEPEADQMASRLQELDTQLRSRDFGLIKAARETLAQTPAHQVQIQISQAMKDGVDNVKIHLYPAELGAVDVTMEIDKEGTTKVHVIAERQETLDLLRRDAQTLTKSLNDAGVSADSNSLQFSLRGESQGDRNFGSNNNGGEQTNKQLAAAVNDNYSRFTRINDSVLNLSIANKSLNILV